MTYNDLIVISSLVPRVLSLPPSREEERGLWERGWKEDSGMRLVIVLFDGVFELWVFQSSPETRSKNKTTRESVGFKA